MNKLLTLLALVSFPAIAQGAPVISIEGMVSFIIYIVIIALIFWVVWWFIGYVGVPEPFNKVIRVVIGLVALLIVISLLLALAGHPMVVWR